MYCRTATFLWLLRSFAYADSVANSSAKSQKYNVLFLMCDSMDGRVLDPTSPVSSYLEMPYMWSLAAQGLNFVNTYAASPQCSPSRTTMFTGRHMHKIQAWSNQKGLAATPGSGQHGGSWELDRNCVENFDEATCRKWAQEQNVSATFMDTLADAGVKVALYGKVDVGGNIIHREDQKHYNPTVAGHGKSLAMTGRAADIRKATKQRPDAKTHVPTKEIHAPDWKITKQCMEWLESNPNAGATNPWLLYCSLVIPHPPYECNAKTEAHIAADIPMPKWFSNPNKYPEDTMHPYDSYMSYSKDMMDEQGNFSEALLEKNMRCWLAMCNQTDVMLGQVWAKAAATGNLKNTIVIFTSDHGEMHMEHRQHLKNSMYEGSSRVPLLIAGPGIHPMPTTRQQFAKGTLVKDVASLLDIYPTFVEAVGATPPNFLDGFSLMSYLGGTGKRPEDYVISMYMSNMANTQAFMIRQGPWKYIAFGQYGPSWYRSYHPQLFNLDEDPGELNDVSKSHIEDAARLNTLLRSVVDIDAVDRAVKMDEKFVYDRFYKALAKDELFKQWQNSYRGFDEKDMSQVQNWYDSVESSPQPGTSILVV